MEHEVMALPSAVGILHCLQLLAQEAASLNLQRTFSAIEDALQVAVCETGTDVFTEDLHAPGPHMVH